MKQFINQFLKELSAYFYGLNAYVILSIYSILSILCTLYAGEYFLRDTDVMNAFFIMQPLVLILTIPAVTMRTWSEEIKSGTIELLMTQPISYFKLTISKFFAAYAFFIIMLFLSFPLLFISDIFSVLDMGIIYSSYVGLLLSGALFTAVGCCLSVLCRNNVISYIATIFLLFIIYQFTFNNIDSETLFLSLDILNFNYNYSAFLHGTISPTNIAYFICGTLLFIWLNVVFLYRRQTDIIKNPKPIISFIFLLYSLFCTTIISVNLLLSYEIDLTTTKRYTLLEKNANYLRNLDKRINITLYEAKSKRNEGSSNYAALAEYIERLLKRIERYSLGNVRYEISQVESLSASERRLVQENIPYEEDNWGNKIYMVADFSDNDGNHQRINSFTNLRQNFIETDIIRSLHLLGHEKKNIAIIASPENLKQMQAFNNVLQEFYNITFLNNDVLYLPTTYDAIITINPVYASTELLLALEQYVLSGGSLVIFHEPHLLSLQSNTSMLNFLNTFGIKPVLPTDNNKPLSQLILAKPIAKWHDIYTVMLNNTGKVQTTSSPNFQIEQILSIDDKIAAVKSTGKYATNFPELAAQSKYILPFSSKEGNVFFIYDSDVLHDSLFSSPLSTNTNFYQILPLNDNLLFVLRLMDYATNSHVDDKLSYRHYLVNPSSIGITIFNMIQKRYDEKMQNLNLKLAEQNQKRNDLKNMMLNKGYASVKHIGNINSLTQKTDEIIDEINRTRQLISQEYQNYIAALTVLLILIIPGGLLLLLWLGILGMKRYRLNKVRRLITNAKTH